MGEVFERNKDRYRRDAEEILRLRKEARRLEEARAAQEETLERLMERGVNLSDRQWEIYLALLDRQHQTMLGLPDSFVIAGDDGRYTEMNFSRQVEILEKTDRREAVERQRAESERAKQALDAIRKSQAESIEIPVKPDAVVTIYKNYKRPVASPKMEVALPETTDTGTIMPPLPTHECELPEAVQTITDRRFDDRTDNALLKDKSVFECICGKAWYLRIHTVPFHAAKYKGQLRAQWREIHWYNFARKADLRNRKETK